MPYLSSGTIAVGGKRRARRSRRPRRSATERSVAEYAVAAYKGVKYLKGLVNSEMYKSDQIVTTLVPFALPALVTPLTNIAQGDGDATRTGNSILLKSIYLQSTENAGATGITFSRYLIVEDLQQNADTAPTWGDIFDNSGLSSPLNSDTVGRFKILWDTRSTYVGATQTQAKFWKKYIRLQHHVRYNGTAATDIQKGGLYLVQLATNAGVGQTLCIRSSYHDN